MTEHTLRVLLVEDDATSCMEINDYISRLDDVTLVASTNNASTAIEYMKSITNKSGQAFYNIGKERLMNALVPVPPLAEQGRIDRQITDVFSRIKA